MRLEAELDVAPGINDFILPVSEIKLEIAVVSRFPGSAIAELRLQRH
jgi:hypothetical protein